MWLPAPAVAKVAAGLIERHHVELVGAPVVYIFRETAAVSRGRRVLGRARLVTGLYAFLVALAVGDVPDDPDDDADHVFFVMEIAQDHWDEMTPAERAALVDHELCHMAVDEDGRLSTRGHDIEEFTAVVERHGLWREDVRFFAGACASSADCSVA